MKVKKRDLFLHPLSRKNPVTVQMLGICSALAVTTQLEPACIMAISVVAVTGFSNLILSLMRNTIPSRIRFIIQLIVVAGLVSVVNEVLRAYAYDVSRQLSVFIGLIITNCIVMGRIEAFALGNKPLPSFIDGIGNGMGYGIVLIIVGFFRELFGSGTLWGKQVIPDSFYEAGYFDNGMVILPPMALIIVACIIWIHRLTDKNIQEIN
jgi:Na+-transporting NADH:ubiquinone oxidoreductase subunit D